MEEASYYPKREFDPAATILFRLYQLGLAREDLVPVLRSKAKVNKILSGQLEITRWNARKLGEFLDIPATDLLATPEEGLDEPMDGIEPLGFPLQEMARLGWIENVEYLKDYRVRA